MRTLLTISIALLLVGCSRFTTRQTDITYKEGNPKPEREITTRASAWTFFSGKSQLTSFKANQTDKSQGATVGSLVQEGGQTNQASDIAAAVTAAAIKAAVR